MRIARLVTGYPITAHVTSYSPRSVARKNPSQHKEKEMGYVVKEAGRYLCKQKTITHTGAVTFGIWTEDLNEATVFYDLQTRYLFDDSEIIEATETRTVTLVSPSAGIG